MKVKELAPLIDDCVVIEIQSAGRWRIDKDNLSDYEAEKEIKYVTASMTKVWEETKWESLDENGFGSKGSHGKYVEKTVLILHTK